MNKIRTFWEDFDFVFSYLFAYYICTFRTGISVLNNTLGLKANSKIPILIEDS